VDAGTKALELENGAALNEPTTYAVRVAIEQAVYDMIVEGEKKGLWRYKKPKPIQPPVVSEEVKKDELVQQTAPPKAGQEETITTPKSTDGGVVRPQPVPIQSKEKSQPNVSIPEKQKQTGLVLDWVNVRKEKFRTSDVLGKLQPGDTVEVVDIEPWFIRINYQGKEGWIPKQFIKVQ
jgi:hypothetical protein